jgi:hypothetical protein
MPFPSLPLSGNSLKFCFVGFFNYTLALLSVLLHIYVGLQYVGFGFEHHMWSSGTCSSGAHHVAKVYKNVAMVNFIFTIL